MMAVVSALLIYAGWARLAWWTPFAVTLAFALLGLLQAQVTDSWRLKAGLAERLSVETFIMGLLLTALVYAAAYWLGRGVRSLTDRYRRTAP